MSLTNLEKKIFVAFFLKFSVLQRMLPKKVRDFVTKKWDP